MNIINSLDLNLVRVFVAVMETRSTTRAGEKLGLTQSAVSHALNKLRAITGDVLFIRTPSEMHPTPRAEEMAPALRAALYHVETAFGPPEFDPARSDMRFSVALTDYVAATLFPPFAERIRDRGLTIGFSLRSLNEVNVTDELDLGTLHVAIGVFRRVPSRFVVDPVAQLDNVWAMRADHPATLAPFDLAALARHPHLDIRLAERPADEDLERNVVTSNPARLDALLAERGLTRRVGGVVGHYLAVAPILARSDMIAFIPAGMARHFRTRYDLVWRAPPYPTEPMDLSLLFHRTLGSHPAIVWLRRELHDLACARSFEAPPAN